LTRRPFLAALALLLAACGAGAPHFEGSDVTGASFGHDFSLTDSAGHTRTLADYRGKAVALFFGYTQCPDVCPTTLAALAEAMKKLGPDADRVQVLFVTVDPARDTPALLAEYVASFHPRLLGLSGSEAEVAAAAKAWKVHRRKVLTSASAEDYLVDHGSLMYLMGPDGRFLTLFPANTPGETMAAAMRKYVE